MVLTKERKVLFGLLGSAGLILGIDQLFLGPPQRATADVPATAPAPAAAMPPSQTAVPTTGTATPGTSAPVDPSAGVNLWNDRLEQVHAEADGSSDAVDPFSASAESDSASGITITPARFASDHTLSAVVTSGAVGVAMVNGRAVRIGDEISGYRLIRVDTRSAEFQAGEEVVRLDLPMQGRDGS
ncbi:MAG: hypothetical protein AAFV77_09565 [Planctomycetota bacterium]